MADDALSDLAPGSKVPGTSEPTGHSMSGPVQLAYAVPNVREAAAGWAPLGVGPFFVRDHIELGSTRINGVTSTFDHSSAYGWWGDLMFELICQHDTGGEMIVPGSGLHHVAHFVDDFDAVSKQLIADGHAEVLHAETGGGMNFAFYNGGAARGHLIEIYEPVPGLRKFYDMVRNASIDWDGSDPIRTL